MSTLPSEIVSGDPLAGVMDDTGLELNEALSTQEEAEPEDAEPVEAETEETGETEERPKKNKTPRDERIKQLAAEKKTLQQQIEDLKNGSLQSQIDELKKLLAPVENSVTIPVNRDAEPDPNDLDKYRLGDLDPAYTRDLVRYELRAEQAAEHQRQVQREARAKQERQASEVLEKVSAVADKGAALYDDYVETVVQPFMQGRIPLEEHTFLAASEAPHGAEVLRELALNLGEATRVASMTPFQQVSYVSEKSREIAARNKPRLPQAGAPPSSMARGTGGRFGIRGDEDNLSIDDLAKVLATRR
mgnify:CR=1 FL=1